MYNVSMISPRLSNERLLDDIAAARADTENFHLWWLGQSGFLIQWQDQHLLFDPYLSDSLTHKYATTDKPHIRMTERVIAPEQLDFIDVVTSSHNHTDHLDGETLIPLLRVNPAMQVVVPEANRAFAADRIQVEAARLSGINAGEAQQCGAFQISAIPAAHEELETDAQGQHVFLGYVAQFGPWTVYHSGDTIWYPGLEDQLRPWSIDLAILPINGSKPERRVAGNLDGVEAAKLAHTIGAKMVIPCHFEMFTFNTESPALFVSECQRLHQPYQVLRAGERWRSIL